MSILTRRAATLGTASLLRQEPPAPKRLRQRMPEQDRSRSAS